jgi:large subunit ribosomal protein L21
LEKQNIEDIMYAIVDIAGKQFKVEKEKFIYAPLMEAEEGAAVDFDNVLLVDNDGKVKVGTPTVKGAKVSGKVLEHVKGDKVIVFKKKRRKGYRKKNGHRQQFTKVLIEDIK